LLKPVNRGLSLLAAWSRLAHAIILAVAINNLVSALYLVTGSGAPPGFEGQVMRLLGAFNSGWLIGLVFFGLHCLLLGYLVYRSGYLPGILGILLVVAGVGYLVDSFANFLLPNYGDYATVFLVSVAVPALLAEVPLCLWLLWKGAGVKVP
jgi:hypothetical protein